MTEHARERGRACDHVALHLKRAGQFGHGDVRLGLDAPDQKGLVGGQLPAPARAPPVGRLNRPCSVRPLEKLDGATRADPKMPGRVTARMPGPHVPHDARPQIQGITLAHDRSPDHEESSIAAPVTPIGVKLASYGIADIRLSFASGMGEASMHVGGGLQEVMESDAADDGDQQHTSGDVPHAPERRGISSVEQVLRGRRPGNPGRGRRTTRPG